MLAGAIIATCFGIPLAVFGGALLYDRFEGFVAAKLAEDAGCDRSHGDCPVLPDDFELLHHARENGL